MNNLNIFDAYSLALQEDKNSIYSKIGINVILHDKKFSKSSIQWSYHSIPNHIYIAIDKLSNSNIVKGIENIEEPSISINEDVEHTDYKLYNIGEKIYAISMNSDIMRSYFPGQIFLQLSENGKEIIYNYINVVPDSFKNTENNINQNFEMELDQRTNQELSKKYGFSVDPSLLLQQYQYHPNPEIAFIGKELYHYIKDTIQYRIRFSLDALVKIQLFEVNTQDIFKFKNENLMDDTTVTNHSSNNENINLSNIDIDDHTNFNGNDIKTKKNNKRCFDEMDDTNNFHNSFSSLFSFYDKDGIDKKDEDEIDSFYINNCLRFGHSRKLKCKNNSTFVLVLEWKYPPEIFQKIPLWNNRLKRKAYFCHDWTKNESATNSSRHYIFGTRTCLANIYYSILKRVPRLFKLLESNNLIFEPNIIKHRTFPKPFIKNYFSSTSSTTTTITTPLSSSHSHSSVTLPSTVTSTTPVFDKEFLQTQTIQNLRQIVFDHDLFDEIDLTLGKENIICDLLLYDVIDHHLNDQDNEESNNNSQLISTSSCSDDFNSDHSLNYRKNSYYYIFNTMDDQTIQSMFTIPTKTLKVLQDHGFDFEQHMPYGYFKIKLEKYPLCFQNFLWNHIHQPKQLNDYLNDVVPVEVQWNYQIPEFLISIVKDETSPSGEENYHSTLKVSKFVIHNTNPDIYWCFCQRRMLTTDYYHHCEKCGICYDINYWHCNMCQRCSLGINIGVCNFCGKAREAIH